MSQKNKKEVIVFYSWQSDLPKKSTLNAIRNALREAIKEIEINGIKIILDEATRDEPGSPDIPNTILEKISLADIFIADITTINKDSSHPRKTANPNVLIELGYAVAELGWKRIIMLFNQEYGKMPDDVAFDIDRKRISLFRLNEEIDKKKKIEFEQLLVNAISLIIKKDPLKPYQKKGIDPKLRKRQHDINKLTFLLSYLHTSSIDAFIETAPSYIHSRIFHFYDTFKGIFLGSGFFLYDRVAYKIINKIYKYWSFSLSCDHLYHETSDPNVHKFGHLYGNPITTADREKYLMLENSVSQLHKYYNKLLNHIRHNYIELELGELSKKAYEDYASFYEKE